MILRHARLAIGFAVIGASSSIASSAPGAPSNAPALSAAAARQSARDALAAITASLVTAERAKVDGIYAAFDASPSDLVAMAACDDDGDPVVVVSDPLLALVDLVARAKATDDVLGTNKVGDYAVFLARTQSTAGTRTLPPPPGFYEETQSNDPRVRARADVRRRQGLDAMIGHEVAHFVQGDFACPHPTATREAGDTTWTGAEARAAQEAASKVYTAPRVLSADVVATRWLIGLRPRGDEDDDPSEAYVALLAVFDHLPASAYARLHEIPGTTTAGAVREQVVRAAASEARVKPAP